MKLVDLSLSSSAALTHKGAERLMLAVLFRLGQVWKGPPGMTHHDPPDPSMDPAHKTLKWIDNSQGIDVEQRRGAPLGCVVA